VPEGAGHVRGLTAARRRPEVEDDAVRLTLGVKVVLRVEMDRKEVAEL
jgi:hypothetical protein